MSKTNGNLLKSVSIVIGILLAIGSIVWAFATQSNNLAHAVDDVIGIEVEVKIMDERVDVVEGALIGIQKDVEYIRGDMIEQKGMSKEILEEVRK